MSTASTAVLVQVSAVQAHKTLLFLKLLAGSTWRLPKIRTFLITAQGGLTGARKEHPKGQPASGFESKILISSLQTQILEILPRKVMSVTTLYPTQQLHTTESSVKAP